MCGTPTYVAPEIIDSKSGRGYGKSVDIWAVGVIAFIMLSGSTPFYDDSMPKLFAQIVTAKFTFSKEIVVQLSAEAKDFISRLLEVDILKRLTATGALNHPWISNLKLSSSLTLDGTKSNLREFNARRRLRGAIHVIQVALYLRRDSPRRRANAVNEVSHKLGQVVDIAPNPNHLNLTNIGALNQDVTPVSNRVHAAIKNTSVGNSSTSPNLLDMTSFPSQTDASSSGTIAKNSDIVGLRWDNNFSSVTQMQSTPQSFVMLDYPSVNRSDNNTSFERKLNSKLPMNESTKSISPPTSQTNKKKTTIIRKKNH